MLGFPHPDYLLEKLTASQLSEWYAFDTLEPVGAVRDDYRFSYLSAVITNLAIRIHGKKGTPLASTSDFLFDWDGEGNGKGTTQSLEEMKNVFQQMASMGKVIDKKYKRTRELRKHAPRTLNKNKIKES